MKKGNRTFGKILMVLTLAFFYLPILYMIIFSFNAGKSLTAFTGFSLRWYQHMLDSKDMMEALYTTFTVAIIATLISTAVGTISAIGLSKSKKILRDVMDQVNNFPMMNPEIVTAIGFMLLFITFKIEKGYATMLLAHIAFCIPYVMPLRHAEDPLPGSQPGRRGHGPGRYALAGIDPRHRAGDYAGYHFRRADCVYHVGR